MEIPCRSGLCLGPQLLPGFELVVEMQISQRCLWGSVPSQIKSKFGYNPPTSHPANVSACVFQSTSILSPAKKLLK